MKKIAIFAVTFLLFTQFVFSQNKIEDFDKYVESARKEWKVPGMSIVVVQDGKVLLSKGYGVRELGKDSPVDNKTLFGAMSTTKAMTVVGLAMLVDEGKVKWDDKVVDHLPDFKITDAYVTREMKIRDMLTHNTGLGNADFLWSWTPQLSSKEIVERMKYAEQAYSFRGGYTYQNIMYLVAGQVIEKLSGMSWNRFMKERLFTPLGMNDTYPTFGESTQYTNRSLSHYEVDGKILVIPEMSADQIGPAGSVWSTSDDIGKWVNFMLGNTTVNGKALLKPETHAEILKAHVIVPRNQFYPTTKLTKPNWTTYGLGWFQHDYRGEMVNFHTGSLAGRTAIIGLLPQKKLGVYIFGNLDHAEVRHALMYKVFDLFGFDDDSRDWSSEMKTMYQELKAQGKKQSEAIKAKRVKDAKPSLPMSAYVGTYSDPFYGTMEVKMVNGKLRLIVNPDMSGDLNHWHFDTFQANWDKSWFGESYISFELNTYTGEVASINFGGAILKRK